MTDCPIEINHECHVPCSIFIESNSSLTITNIVPTSSQIALCKAVLIFVLYHIIMEFTLC